jgi:hypothetical protein
VRGFYIEQKNKVFNHFQPNRKLVQVNFAKSLSRIFPF